MSECALSLLVEDDDLRLEVRDLPDATLWLYTGDGSGGVSLIAEAGEERDVDTRLDLDPEAARTLAEGLLDAADDAEDGDHQTERRVETDE